MKKNNKQCFQQLELFVYVNKYIDFNVCAKESDSSQVKCDIETKTEEPEKEPDDPVDFYSSVGSPILSEGKIIFKAHKFDPVFSWSSETKLDIEELITEKVLSEEFIKSWILNNAVYPLINPDEAKSIMELDYDNLFLYVKALPEKQIQLFLGDSSNMPQVSDLVLDRWRLGMRRVESELFSRLGLLRLGKNRLSSEPRVWIGRSDEALSPKIVFKCFDHQRESVGQNFIETFIGNRAFDKNWTLSYRGCLWRITEELNGYKKCTYIEEFNHENIS